MNTGEDIQGLRKIVDFTRLISIFILSIHFYLSCYRAFFEWGFTAEITNDIIANISKTGLFSNLILPKLISLLCLIISLIGVKGKKDEKINTRVIVCYLLTGVILYFVSGLCFYLNVGVTQVALWYMSVTIVGYLLILTGGGLLSRLIKKGLSGDIFNTIQETFPQEERLLENEYSVNLPAKYNLKGKIRESFINLISMTRGLLVAGTPGS